MKTLLEDEKCRNLTEESSKFWILCNSLGEFIKENGSLPLSGTLPDMTSDSARYVQLSTAFRDQVHQLMCNLAHLLQYFAYRVAPYKCFKVLSHIVEKFRSFSFTESTVVRMRNL